jgi:hypothetical protein
MVRVKILKRQGEISHNPVNAMLLEISSKLLAGYGAFSHAYVPSGVPCAPFPRIGVWERMLTYREHCRVQARREAAPSVGYNQQPPGENHGTGQATGLRWLKSVSGCADASLSSRQ